MRFPLQGAVLLETSYISLDDRFAAQIVLSLGLGFGAPGVRALPLRTTAAGRCPPMSVY